MAARSRTKKDNRLAAAYNLPPQNIEAEKCILGIILTQSRTVYNIFEKLKQDDFYLEIHRIIYKAMEDLFNRSQPHDIIAVTDVLRNANQLEHIGGPAYLATLTDIVPISFSAWHYIDIILDKSLLRQLIAASSKINLLCFEKQGNVSSILDEAESVIFAISNSKSQSAYKPVVEFARRSFERVEKLSENNDPITGIPTGFEQFDTLTAGLQPANLIIIAARPSMGKTALAMNIAQNVKQ